MYYKEQEENNYPKAFLYTGVILVVFMALSYLIIISIPRQEDGTGGILVNYGTSEEGMGTDYMSMEEPSVAEKANKTRPEKVTKAEPTEQVVTEKSNQKVVTQTAEDAPEVVTNDKKPSTAVATKETKAEPAKPTVNQNALYTGKKNDGSGEGDGTGSTPGNQGKTTGTTLTNNYDGTGSGNGGNLTGMAQRNFVSKPNVTDNGRISGKIVVDIRVDRNGNITYARAGARGTTISDAALLEKCENAVKNSKLNSLDTAPDLQIGTVVFVFQVK